MAALADIETVIRQGAESCTSSDDAPERAKGVATKIKDILTQYEQETGKAPGTHRWDVKYLIETVQKNYNGNSDVFFNNLRDFLRNSD
jgi:hypothetical protein